MAGDPKRITQLVEDTNPSENDFVETAKDGGSGVFASRKVKRLNFIGAMLRAIRDLATTGFVTRTGDGTAVTRTIEAGSTKITILNGDGILGNPTIDVDDGQVGDVINAENEGESGFGLFLEKSGQVLLFRRINGSDNISINLNELPDRGLTIGFHGEDVELSGIPTAPTAAPNTNSTQIATTEYVDEGLALKADLESGKVPDSQIPDYIEIQWLPAAGKNGATAAPVWDLPDSNAPTPSDVAGSNIIKGVLDFSDSETQSAQITLLLPLGWTGDIDAKILWSTSVTSGNCVWQLQTAFAATDGSGTSDPTFNAAQTVMSGAPGTANNTKTASISTLTTTGAAAGKLMHLKILRDPAHGSDNLGAVASLIGVEITWRRTI